jgi:hypothetical protein
VARTFGTVDDIRQACERLTDADLVRIHRAAGICLPGTHFTCADDILNEVMVRALAAAQGGAGRRWPLDVEFVAFLIMTMRSLADDSRHAFTQTRFESVDSVQLEGVAADDVYARHGMTHPDAPTLASAALDEHEREQRAVEELNRIDEYFKGDSEVAWIIEGRRDGLSANEIRNLSEMDEKQYEAARKRFRRGLQKLFPGRAAS